MTALTLHAQAIITLHSFDGSDGRGPSSWLIQATDGRLYGTSFGGGANGYGTVFTITAGGTLTTLHDFGSQSGDGSYPKAGLIQGEDGKFYGTTVDGGANDDGTVFSITTGGKLKTLYSFCSQTNCTDGETPYAGLIEGTDGKFYGTTFAGGNYHDNNVCSSGCGTVFSITADGKLTTLHSFDNTVGSLPEAGLIQGTDGKFYGTTLGGGTGQGGIVFSITADGTLKTLHNFCSQTNCTDGATLYGGLLQGADGNFYGAANGGGAHGYGTVFSITADGMFTKLYDFCSRGGITCTDGSQPEAGLIHGSDGNLYGTTTSGGGAGGRDCPPVYSCGTIFRITPSGTLTTLDRFDDMNGRTPIAVLFQSTDGAFHGTTVFGGAYDIGTLFSLSVGLGPFVETQPTYGKVGAPVKILGNTLTGTTSVTFNGTAATFVVVSSSLITTTVPAGATSGKVQVVTPAGTLSSNVVFRVRP